MRSASVSETLQVLSLQTASLDAEGLVTRAANAFGTRVALASSLGLGDQVLTDMIARLAPQTPIFTLDTGRLFPETLDLLQTTRDYYGLPIRVFCPDPRDVEEMVNNSGPNLFRESIEQRKRCCHVRKVLPLRRALSGLDAWICGLRREQSTTREAVQPLEWDDAHGLVKISPLADWSEAQVREYIRKHRVPYNRLHDKGFPSIGCACCTRAVLPGEDARAGRWWWESADKKECGLHWERGKLVRKQAVGLQSA